jgi:arylsulfatase
MIDRMDQNIGRLLSKLDDMGVANNTLVLFLSDNGASKEVVKNVKSTGEIGSLTRWSSLGPDWANVSNTPLRFFKNYSSEGGIKTPMIVNWPNAIKQKNKICKTPLHLIDLMSTFVDILDVEYPKEYNNQKIYPLDGISFLPLLIDQEVKRGKPLFWQYKDGKAIRDDDWKLVAYKKNWKLYNLKTDPVEQNDVSNLNLEKFNELKVIYDAWEKEFEMQ